MAKKMGFQDFTALQEKVFTDEKFYDLSKWLFVLGATSSGKTLVALLAYFFEHEVHAKKNLPYKMLFTVPYRALASQKTAEVLKATNALGLNLKIYQSTSEYLADDEKILHGDADIAIIINEKVFMFAGMDNNFLDRYNLIVLDEIHLVREAIRGIKTDFILLNARQRKKVRIIALGTPFYNWDSYLEKFGFILFQETKRPINVLEFPVIYDDEKICEISEDCKAVAKINFSESDFFQNRKKYNESPHLLIMIAEICRYHIQRNERILIFFEKREDARKFSKMLAEALYTKDILALTMNKQSCRQYIQDKIQAQNAEILYGLFDDEDYFAFACGVSYHNANMFSALRSIIEKDFLSENGRLKIVCSTETLAYGVNTNADVVIIPRLKRRNHDKISNSQFMKRRFLYPNEYMNYCGRSGRLNSNYSIKNQKKVGWVYPFIRSNTVKKHPELKLWGELQNQIHSPEVIVSKFWEENPAVDEIRPFFILSLFSVFQNKKSGISVTDFVELLENLPGRHNFDYKTLERKLSSDIEKSIAELIKRNLVYEVESDEDDEKEIPRFKTSDIGRGLSGYVLSLKNYDDILGAICNYVTKKTFFAVDMFYSVITTNEIIKASKFNIGGLNIKSEDNNWLQQAVNDMRIIFLKLRPQTTPQLHFELMKCIEKFEKKLKINSTYIGFDEKFVACRILAATLFWYHGKDCSPTKIYDSFKICYEPLRSRIIDIISYRFEVIRIVLPLAPSQEKGRTLRYSLGMERISKVADNIKCIIDKIMYYPSQEICDFLKIDYCDLYKAQMLRDIERLYKILKSSEDQVEDKTNVISRLAKQLENYPEWKEIFIKKFGGEVFFG